MGGRVRVEFGPENGAYDMFGQVVEKNSSFGSVPSTPLQFMGRLKDSFGSVYHLNNTALIVGDECCRAYSSSFRKVNADLKTLEALTSYPLKIHKREDMIK